MVHYYYYCDIYLRNINHHIKSLMSTELQHIQLLLRCVRYSYENCHYISWSVAKKTSTEFSGN